MERRAFIASGLALLAAPLAVGGQPRRGMRCVGQYWGGTRVPAMADAYYGRLAELGFVNGKNVRLEERPVVPATRDGFLTAARELLALPADVLVSWGTVASVAARQVTSTTPVVFLSVPDPVAIGLVAGLAHPGGNMTGVTFEAAAETPAKRLQMLTEAVPRLSRVGILHAQGDPNVQPQIDSIQHAADLLRIRVVRLAFQRREDLDLAFSDFHKQAVQGLLVVNGALTFATKAEIVKLALAHKLPSIHAYRESVELGGLLSLGPNYVNMAKQGAALVAKILNGTKPADIPVEQPTQFETWINLKTAKALGLTIPESLLLRADEVIQ